MNLLKTVNMNYNLILENKQKQLLKLVKGVVAMSFEKPQRGCYDIDLVMFNGSFSGEVRKRGETILDTGFFEIEPQLSYGLESMIVQLDRNINKMKELHALIKSIE